MGEDATPGDMSRYTVPEAARALGISPEAVRNRLSRGTLKSVKEAGTVYVLLDPDMVRPIDDRSTDRPDDTSAALLEQMQARIDSLERQLEQAGERDRENRRIIAALTSRIPAIEAPSDEPAKQPEAEATGPQEGVRSPWWRRVFGG